MTLLAPSEACKRLRRAKVVGQPEAQCVNALNVDTFRGQLAASADHMVMTGGVLASGIAKNKKITS